MDLPCIYKSKKVSQKNLILEKNVALNVAKKNKVKQHRIKAGPRLKETGWVGNRANAGRGDASLLCWQIIW